MPKVSEEASTLKRESILDACAAIYESKSFKEITLKDIATLTSFSRPSIYNYFQTKEEIFLGLIKREYDLWNSDLDSILNGHDTLDSEEFASLVATSLSKRELLLKIMAMNHYDMEENSREENLIEFKVSYGKALTLFTSCLTKFFPALSEKEVQDIIYTFFPFMFGIYPYCFVSSKQRQAMDAAKTNYVFNSPYQIIYSCLKTLLKVQEK